MYRTASESKIIYDRLSNRSFQDCKATQSVLSDSVNHTQVDECTGNFQLYLECCKLKYIDMFETSERAAGRTFVVSVIWTPNIPIKDVLNTFLKKNF